MPASIRFRITRPGLTYTKLFSERQTLYCGERHPLFGIPESEQKPEEIERLPFVRRTYYGGTLQTGAFRPKRVVANADSMEALALLVLSGEMIGHLPAEWVRNSCIHAKLQALVEDRFSYDSNFEIVFKTGAQHTKLVRTFLREVFLLYGISNLDIKPKRRRSVRLACRRRNHELTERVLFIVTAPAVKLPPAHRTRDSWTRDVFHIDRFRYEIRHSRILAGCSMRHRLHVMGPRHMERG